jgi:hypothetical protein
VPVEAEPEHEKSDAELPPDLDDNIDRIISDALSQKANEEDQGEENEEKKRATAKEQAMERYLAELEELKKTRINEKQAFYDKIANDKQQFEWKQQQTKAARREH